MAWGWGGGGHNSSPSACPPTPSSFLPSMPFLVQCFAVIAPSLSLSPSLPALPGDSPLSPRDSGCLQARGTGGVHFASGFSLTAFQPLIHISDPCFSSLLPFHPLLIFTGLLSSIHPSCHLSVYFAVSRGHTHTHTRETQVGSITYHVFVCTRVSACGWGAVERHVCIHACCVKS